MTMNRIAALFLLLTLNCGSALKYQDNITCYSNGTVIYRQEGVDIWGNGAYAVYFRDGRKEHVSGTCVVQYNTPAKPEASR